MQDAVSVPVTVKHRIGLGREEPYAFVRDFVGALHTVGIRMFIVHARNAWLEGLSPKDNREVPPLRYAVVHQLKADFPDAGFLLNGGLDSIGSALQHGAGLDGVMLGRAAYHDPWLLAEADRCIYGDDTRPLVRAEVVVAMADYAQRQIAEGVPLRSIVRHMLGLYHGRPGARAWRRTLSDARLLADADAGLLMQAMREVERAGAGGSDQPPALPVPSADASVSEADSR
jgi:tRNA-dihydrouridine synthase A